MCVSYHGRVICIEKMYVPHHMIPVWHTCNTHYHQHWSLLGLQNQLGLPFQYTWNLAHDFKPIILTETWAEFLFYCISFRAIDFIFFILKVIDFFYCFWEQICDLLQFCYRLQQKTQMCMNVGQVSI
jgi:hypothetical protein